MLQLAEKKEISNFKSRFFALPEMTSCVDIDFECYLAVTD